MSEKPTAVHRRSDLQFTEVGAGIQRCAWQGDGFAQVRLIMSAGAVLPRHEHPEAQYTFVTAGALRFTTWPTQEEERTVDLGPGDGVWIPPLVPHEATALVEAETVESFVPRLPQIASPTNQRSVR
jgi:quercetin dioxygenase-like cupin family protein